MGFQPRHSGPRRSSNKGGRCGTIIVSLSGFSPFHAQHMFIQRRGCIALSTFLPSLTTVLCLFGLATPLPAASLASLAPLGWDSDLKLAEARDTDPDPTIVEVTLTARVAEVEVAAGSKVAAWTYDGHLPGPLIRAHVGDRVIVHFTNDLPQPTTIHWHGIRVPIEMD